MTDNERGMGEEWFEKHRCKGKRLIFLVEPTGIADTVVAQCAKCGEEKNVTDFDRW